MMKDTHPLTHEEFLARARAAHGTRYDYPNKYQGQKRKMTIVCRVHGPFDQLVRNHWKGSGCPRCAYEKMSADQVRILTSNRQTSTSVFVEKARAVHGDRYDYAKTEYVNRTTPITITCPVHGDVTYNPAKFLKTGCYLCVADASRRSTEDFIAMARAQHGDRYDYSETTYRSYRHRITYRCPVHGLVTQSPEKHLKSTIGCTKCFRALLTKTTERFIAEATELHGDHLDFSQVDYVNNFTKVKVVCKHHGEFLARPNNLLAGHGCPFCVERRDFADAKHALLYYLRVHANDKLLYKVGITRKKTVKRRWYGQELNGTDVVLIKSWPFSPGKKAWQAEQKILARFKADRYKGPLILLSGNTELFTRDVLGLDTKNFRKHFTPEVVAR